MQINFLDKLSDNTDHHIFVLKAKRGNIGDIAKEYTFEKIVNQAAEQIGFQVKNEAHFDILGSTQRQNSIISVIGIDDKNEIDTLEFEKIGGIAAKIANNKSSHIVILADFCQTAYDVACIASGVILGHYRFDQFKSQTNSQQEKRELTSVTLISPFATQAEEIFNTVLNPLASGTLLARDLVNLPPNVLDPKSFANKAKDLEKLGLKVEILGEKELLKKGLSCMYAVGQGSEKESFLAIMHWQGAPESQENPLGFVGKGITFDTGGISLKPAAAMDGMKGDMAGAAAVTGLMQTLALRKAKVNAIGVIALAENMPSGKAQRPDDIVKTYAGKTVEILNTDAEGRLVLADAIAYTIDCYKPQFIIELSTLTGAMLVALGQEYAGFFSNNDSLASQLEIAGRKVGDKVWRLPIDKAYDKLIDSKIADMKNIGGRFAGSITAAQFLFRFVKETSFVHIDIAGTAIDSPKNPLNSSWSSGFGVRLLDQFIRDNYEQ